MMSYEILQSQDLEFARNLGFMSEEEQDALNRAHVSIAGAGGDGGLLAIQLARMGVGNFRIADPDPFEVENINRQASCSTETIGRNKAEVIGDTISRINPRINVEVITEGVTKGNVESFVQGATLVIDEMEFTLHSLGVVLARQARARNIPVVMAMNIGFGGAVTSFHPHGRTYERFLGLGEMATIDEIEKKDVPLSRWVPHVPSYIDIRMLEKVAKGEKSAPSIAPGVAVAAGMAATQAFLNLTRGKNNRPDPVYAPRVLTFDPYENVSKVVRFPRFSHYLTLGKALIKNKANRSPLASY